MNDDRSPAAGDPLGATPTVPDPAGVVVVLNRDLMFGMRIRNALGSLGLVAAFARDTEGFVSLVRSSDPPAALAVIDMNGTVDWDAVAALAADAAVPTPILAFGPHVDVDGRRAAKAAGVKRIVSNGDFHRDTVGLLRRYAQTGSQPA